MPSDGGQEHSGEAASLSSCGWAVPNNPNRVFIVDRLKELIKYKGYQVPPAELEALPLTHPAITDTAVIGVTDDDGEGIPEAFVVRRPGTDLTVDEAIEFVARQITPYKKVRRVESSTPSPGRPRARSSARTSAPRPRDTRSLPVTGRRDSLSARRPVQNRRSGAAAP
ncbi:hypothetical protein ACH4TV_42065 [Streptomyces sp. NPDC020898]|uniref:AMP-binding enzyme n=1 Tax=Streptomyces sp. NPDC020898 TaxID=3365101 RepID=UPI0037B0D79B